MSSTNLSSLQNILDKLKTSTPSRIVNVSSASAKSATQLDGDDLNKHPKGKGFLAEYSMYCNTKLCNILFTNELAKKLDDTGVTANSLHPGVIKTDFLRTTVVGSMGTILGYVQSLFFMTAEEGAQTTISVALSKDIEGVSGEFFAKCRRVDMYDNAKDVTLAKKVWKKSEELVKLTNAEKL